MCIRDRRTTASIGIVTSTAPHASFDELLSQVDAACHEAKELGGNRLLVAGLNEERLDTRSRMMQSALDVREALDQRRFALWCQPVVDLRAAGDGRAHFEILLRWRDAQGQLHPPANLIAAAERFRLGPRLDRYVLSAVLNWLEAHPQTLPLIRQCNLNLGAATLADDEFGDYFATRLQRSSLLPEQLCLEITETSVVRDLGRTRHFIPVSYTHLDVYKRQISATTRSPARLGRGLLHRRCSLRGINAMHGALATTSRMILLTALYFGGAAITIWFLRTPADVTLFWPAAGLAYAMVLLFGLRYAFAVATAQALLHLLLVPAPLTFVGFSVCSNALATVLAVSYTHLDVYKRQGYGRCTGGF